MESIFLIRSFSSSERRFNISSVICVDKDYKPIPYSTAGNAVNEETGVTDEEPAETSPEEETTSVDDNVVVSEALPEGESEESYDDDEDSEPDADIPEEEEEEQGGNSDDDLFGTSSHGNFNGDIEFDEDFYR